MECTSCGNEVGGLSAKYGLGQLPFCPKCFKKHQPKWKIRPTRWLIGLTILVLLYVFADLIDVFISTDDNLPVGIFFSIPPTIVFIIWSAFNERTWSIAFRILWVAGIYPLYGIVFVVFLLLFSVGGIPETDPEVLFWDIAYQIPAIPFFVWAMHRSKYFMEEVVG